MDAGTLREPPIDGDEIEFPLGILGRTRSVLAWKTSGLDAAGLRATVGRSTVTLGGMSQLIHVTGADGRHANLRRLVVEMIDEYARLNGLADLIRESVDGPGGRERPVDR